MPPTPSQIGNFPFQVPDSQIRIDYRIGNVHHYEQFVVPGLGMIPPVGMFIMLNVLAGTLLNNLAQRMPAYIIYVSVNVRDNKHNANVHNYKHLNYPFLQRLFKDSHKKR
jgi:hypothetical protein